MQSEFNQQRDEFVVTITTGDLNQAMRSEDDLQLFMHEIVSSTYGEWMAEASFPLHKKGE